MGKYIEKKKTFSTIHDGNVVNIHYGMRQFPPQKQYFSITFASKDSFGSDKQYISRVAPYLAMLTDFHLVDVDGEPMHYIENAKYWFELSVGISKWQKNTTIPYGFNSFRDVLISHILANVLDDVSTVNYFLRSGTVKGFEGWLEFRKPRLKEIFHNTMKQFNIEMINTNDYPLA